MTPRTPTSKSSIVVLLEETRHLGYSVSDEDVTLGITSIGAPVFDHTGHVKAALSIGGLRSKILDKGGRERAVKLVTASAAEVSRRMGYRP